MILILSSFFWFSDEKLFTLAKNSHITGCICCMQLRIKTSVITSSKSKF